MMSVSELIGVGTRDNFDVRMLILQCFFILLLYGVPYLIAEYTGKKIYYFLTMTGVPLYLLVLAVLGIVICHNIMQTVYLILLAITAVIEYGCIIYVRVNNKRSRNAEVTREDDTNE